MSKIAETCCFATGSLRARELAELVLPQRLGFEPRTISSNDIDPVGIRFDAAVHAEAIANRTRPGWLRLKGPAGETFQYSDLDVWEMQLLDWDLPWEARHSRGFFDELAARPGFTVAYACDADDMFWQTERNPGNWDILGKDRRGLKLVEDPITGRHVIDVSGNPGRIELVQGMRLQSCWRMWFGPGAQRHFDRTRVLAFPEAAGLRLLESGTVFVELYEDGRSPELAEHRRVQQAFRDWLDMEAVAERSGQPSGPLDPRLELEEGSFAHGGVRQATVWLDANGRPVSRSEASHRRVVELSAEGDVVWAGEFSTGA